MTVLMMRKQSQQSNTFSMNNTTEIISNLNESLGEEWYNLGWEGFTLYTDGFSEIISFLGQPIWASDEDDREFSEVTNEYEPLEPYLLRKAQELIININSIINK